MSWLAGRVEAVCFDSETNYGFHLKRALILLDNGSYVISILKISMSKEYRT